jgi:Spy/CpxP family protein refolding chaperone
MIRMTLGALALAFAVALPATSRAQQASPDSTPTATTVAPHRHHRLAHRLFRGVSLTDAEKTQLRAIHQKYAPQIKTAHQSGDKATIRTLRTQQLDEMRTVLTPDQQTTFDANRAALRAKRPSAAPASPAAPPSGSRNARRTIHAASPRMPRPITLKTNDSAAVDLDLTP